jgi:hypothetical protein
MKMSDLIFLIGSVVFAAAWMLALFRWLGFDRLFRKARLRDPTFLEVLKLERTN